MRPAEYTFRFNDLSDTPSPVIVAEHHHGGMRELYVEIDDMQLPRQILRQIPSLYADLIDLAVAVHIADRFAIGRDDLPRCIEVLLPVRHPELFSQPRFMENLRATLAWYTADQWRFDFVLRQSLGRVSERQGCLAFEDVHRAPEVALWSGGLDSLAGVVSRMATESAEHYLLFGSGSNSQLHARQRELAASLSLYQAQSAACTQVIYRYRAGNIPRNRTQRSRGFVFMVLGAVCALLAEQQQLHIYENGVGAINLPFRASEVGLDHTRAVHPISLIEMSRLVSQVVDLPFRFVNPFVFSTKADMCAIFCEGLYLPLVTQTVSCDRLHRERPSQCGNCSSCLLRKQGLRAAGVPDATGYLFPSTKADQPYRSSTGNHLRAMLWQVRVLRQLLASATPWDSLARYYPRLIDVVDAMAAFEGLPPEHIQTQLVQMYGRYVGEWERVQPQIARALLGDEERRDAA